MSSLHFKGEISYASLKVVGVWEHTQPLLHWRVVPRPPEVATRGYNPTEMASTAPPHTHTPRDIQGTPTVYQKSCHLPTGGTFQEPLKNVADGGGLEKQGKKPNCLTGQSSMEKRSRQGRKKCLGASSVSLSIPISRSKGFRFLESLAHTFTHLQS